MTEATSKITAEVYERVISELCSKRIRTPGNLAITGHITIIVRQLEDRDQPEAYPGHKRANGLLTARARDDLKRALAKAEAKGETA